MFTLSMSLAVAIGCLAVAAGAAGALRGADDPDDADESDDTENVDDSGDPESVDDLDDADTYDYAVAQDGSGDYETVQVATDGAKSFPPKRIRIPIRDGVYDEKVEVHAWNPDITLVDEGTEEMVVTRDDHLERISRGRNSTSFTYTLKVRGDDLRTRGLTVESNAGSVKQAVALHVNTDRTVFESCHFLGHQDTIHAAGEGACQYFSDCYVERTTDFIFDGAAVVFEDCRVYSKTNSYVTAASTPANESFSFVSPDCELTADPDVSEVYLGRSWRDHARITFVRAWTDPHAHSDGWHN